MYTLKNDILKIVVNKIGAELCKIEGVSDERRIHAGINLTSGCNNAINICNEIMNMPSIDKVLEAFEQNLPLI